MNLSIDERTLKIAEYITETSCTVRDAAKEFGIAKSTVHKDLTKRLPALDSNLFKKVRRVLDTNFSLRHLRGGESTKRMYLEKMHCHS